MKYYCTLEQVLRLNPEQIIRLSNYMSVSWGSSSSSPPFVWNIKKMLEVHFENSVLSIYLEAVIKYSNIF